jgi:hypothetical protein
MELHEKFSELIDRSNNKEPLSNFTEAEKAIYLIASMACEIQINSFVDVFRQHFTKSEIELTIASLRDLGFNSLAMEFQTILNALVKENCYDEDGYIAVDFDELPGNILDHIETVALHFDDQQIFTDFDNKLLQKWLSEDK